MTENPQTLIEEAQRYDTTATVHVTMDVDRLTVQSHDRRAAFEARKRARELNA